MKKKIKPKLKKFTNESRLPKAKLGKGVDPFMQNAIGNRINYWEERNANGELPQQINLGNVGGQSNLPKFVAQDYGDIDESQFGQQNPNYTENPFLTQEIVKEPDYKNSVQLNKQIQDYRNPKPNITFKKPEMNMLPTMGNKYFQRGMQYLNQSIDHASAIGTDPNSWEQPLDYYNGISNSPFSSTKVDKKYTTLKPKQDSYTLPTQEVQLPERQFSITPNLNKFDNGGMLNQNQYNALQGLGTAVNATQSGINFGKGTLDMIGSMNQNNQVQNMENQLYTQSVFSGNIDNRPMEQYGYNWSGRNALAENGMQIKEIGGQGTPSVEVEGNEHIKLPNGFSQEIKGKSHSEGGIPLNLPLDSKVFSEKLKIETPKGKKSYADLAKKFETKKDFDMLNAKYADGIQKSTADMMIKFKNQQLENLFEMQEQNKMQGLHGQDAQMETMQDYTPEAKYGIHIKPENRGKFNATKKRTGKSTEELTHSKNPITKKRAVFALNASHWSKKEMGGEIDNYARGGKTKRDFQQMYNDNQNVQDFVLNPTYTPENLISTPLNILNNEYSFNGLANIPIKGSYSPGEAEDVISNYKLNPTYKYINDVKNITEGKKRLKEQLQFNKSLTPELSKKIDSAKTFNDLNPIAGTLQQGTYNLHPQAAEHYGLNIAPTRKGLEYLAKKFPNDVKDIKIGVHGQPDISPDKYQALVSKLSEKDKKDYAKTNYQDSEWYYRNPEFKNFKFKNKEDYDRYTQDNKQNQYGEYFFSGTEGLYLKPEYPIENPNIKTPDGKIINTQAEKIIDRQPEYNINPNMDIQFPLPNVYSRTPLNYYQIDPSYIDPRYLDVQPQLNEISRGQRAFQNNLGSRGTTDIANLLQSQANGYNAQQQVFGNKYNYDRGQDATAQQFNAQAKMNTDQYNQQSWFNQLENSIRQRESNIGDQELTDMYRGQERADQALQFKNTKNYIDDTYSQYQNMSPEEWSARMEFLSKFKPKDSEKKYGGKIKPKLKKKNVNNR